MKPSNPSLTRPLAKTYFPYLFAVLFVLVFLDSWKRAGIAPELFFSPRGRESLWKFLTGMIPPDVSLARWRGMTPESPMDVQARILMRKGKRTWVCMGTSPDSCGLAPWNEEGIEEWVGLNDAHQLANSKPSGSQ